MKPFHVILATPYRDREGMINAGRRDLLFSYDEDQQRTEGISRYTSIFGVDTESDAGYLLTYLTNKYPENSYIIVKSLRAGFRERGPLQMGEFTDAGFMPVGG